MVESETIEPILTNRTEDNNRKDSINFLKKQS